MKRIARIFSLLAVLLVNTAFAQKIVDQSIMFSEPIYSQSVTNFSKVIGWKEDEHPAAPEGFTVTRYYSGLENPRWMYVLPNGDLLVAETNSNHDILEKVGAHIVGASHSNDLHKSANRITLLRDSNHDGIVDVSSPFLTDLNQPFGMLLLGDWLYVANTDALVRFKYKEGETKIEGPYEKIVDLPGGKRHWTRNIIANRDGSKIYIAVGSGTNIAEDGIDQELLRADILEIQPDGKNLEVYASGLRNPVGMGWSEGRLWAVVNERDELGDDLVPDYFTHVEKGGFYGWPYVYEGNHKDGRVKEKNVKQTDSAIVPDLEIGNHTASLGLAFYEGKSFPEHYRHGAFIGQHGSWNSSKLVGYKVIFVPFSGGRPSGKPEDFLTGFIVDQSKSEVHGRPVGVTVMPDGSLIVADDVSKVLWRIHH